jgi:hypothetical protein
MSWRTRLQRLAQTAKKRGLLPPPGCALCQERMGYAVFISARELPEGTVVWQEDGPEPCPVCGQVPELIIELVETVVDSPAEAGV